MIASTGNGGVSWSKTVLPGVSACSGGEGGVTNPWLDFAAVPPCAGAPFRMRITRPVRTAQAGQGLIAIPP